MGILIFEKMYSKIELPYIGRPGHGQRKLNMATPKSGSSLGMEENLKKAVTEMLVLTLLSREDMYAPQITQALEEESGGALSIVFPYSVLYRLISNGYITEAYKKIAPDGRRRQYYQITPEGRAYQAQLEELYHSFSGGVELLLGERGDKA